MSGLQNKYSEICPAEHRPELRFDGPALDYPEHMNAVAAVLEGALERGWGERTAYFCGDRVFTFADVHIAVHRYAAALRKCSVGPGDFVVLRMPDQFELVAVLLAVQAIGAIAIPTYVQLRADDLAYRVEDTGARFIVCTNALRDEAETVVTRRTDVTLLLLEHDPAGHVGSLADNLPADAVEPRYEGTHAEALCLLLYTSGSTGAPKGTCHCHRDMLAIADSYWRSALAPNADDVVAGPPSIAFAMGFGLFVYFPLRLGHAAALDADKSPQRALQTIAARRVTIFIGVVSYFNMLARLIEETAPDISSLRHVLTGGEPLTAEAERRWAEVTHCPLEQFIGTTEMLHIFVTVSDPNAVSVDTSTLGKVVQGYEVEVLDTNTLTPVPNGQEGLLGVRGPTGTVYWNKPEQQARIIANGWNVFQDLVKRDEEGRIEYLARYDEVIVSSGYNISPVDVENVLMRHPAIIECACVPAPDPYGQRSAIVKAIVVAEADVQPDDALVSELQDFVKANAPPYMYPRAIEFIDALPKTINGKIKRSELRRRS